MQTISGLLAGLCFAAVLGGVVQLLAPGGSTERTLRLIAALFILAAAAVPLRSVLRSRAAEPVLAQTDAAVQAVLENAERAVEETSRTVLARYGFSDPEIRVAMQARDGEVHARQFEIYIADAKNAQEIAHEIYTLTGEMPRMVFASAASDGG